MAVGLDAGLPAHEGDLDESGEPATPSERAGKDRRWRYAIAVLVVAALAVFGVVAHRFVFSYQPLRPGSYAGATHGGRHALDSSFGSVFAYRFKAGKEFTFEQSFRNDGSRSVTVTGFPTFGDLYYATLVSVELDGEGDQYLGGTPQRWVAFASFSIDPGEERAVRFTYRFRTDCDIDPDPGRPSRREAGSGSVIERTEIAYEYLGIARLATIELMSPIIVEATGFCPAT